jgi:hypothetical protein
MKRYFFDLCSSTKLLYDFHGRFLPKWDQACEYAELIALDLEVEGEWDGWTVVVRESSGKEVFSIPTRQAEAIAA